MRKVVVLFLGALSVLGCSKEQPQDKVGSANLTGGTINGRPPTSEEIRVVLMQAKPNDPEINAFVITDEGGLVTIQGLVPDEQTRADMVNRIKSMPNVTGVRDQLQVSPSQQQQQQQAQQPAGGAAMAAGKSTSATDAVRGAMRRDQPKSAAVIDQLIITDDGSTIVIDGVVPDDSTHDALLDSAKKSSAGRRVTDDMRVTGK